MATDQTDFDINSPNDRTVDKFAQVTAIVTCALHPQARMS